MRTAGAVFAALAIVAGSAQAVQAAATPGWRNYKVAGKPARAELGSVVAFSGMDAWAVGRQGSGPGSVFLRWNGKKWAVPAGAAKIAPQFCFSGCYKSPQVAGTSGADVWVVGQNAQKQPLGRAAHWDGRKWRVVDLPKAADGIWVEAITVISKKDAWASGQTWAGQPYLAHWDGKKWSYAKSPSLPEGGVLTALAATGPRDVWAVGRRGEQALIEHWNGKNWSVVTTPKTPGGLGSITILPGRKMWAVGNSYTGSRATVLRSEGGGAWRSERIPLPVAGYSVRSLSSVAGDSDGSVWVALGSLPTESSTERHTAKYAHWNAKKKKWDIARGATYAGEPYGVAMALVPRTKSLWSVGVVATGPTSGFVEVKGAVPH